MPSFRALKPPHEAVHELGRKALIPLNADDAAGAQRHIAAMRGQSEEVLRCLKALQRDYRTTFANTPPEQRSARRQAVGNLQASASGCRTSDGGEVCTSLYRSHGPVLSALVFTWNR